MLIVYVQQKSKWSRNNADVPEVSSFQLRFWICYLLFNTMELQNSVLVEYLQITVSVQSFLSMIMDYNFFFCQSRSVII
jgi:hypothetical protein